MELAKIETHFEVRVCESKRRKSLPPSARRTIAQSALNDAYHTVATL
jgi:hypothetical protein